MRGWLLMGLLLVGCSRQAASSDGGMETPVEGSEIPFSEICANASLGFVEQQYLDRYGYCGMPISRAELARLPHSTDPSGLTWAEDILPGADCTDADGGLSIQFQRYSEAIAAGRLTYDGQKAYQCRVWGKQRRADGRPSSEALKICEDIFVPNVAVGGACVADFECQGEAYCKRDQDLSCDGRCAPVVKANQPCRPGRDVCESEHECEEVSGAFRCQKIPGPGESCRVEFGDDEETSWTGTRSCQTGSVCVMVENGDVCVKTSKVGEACFTTPSTCEEGDCIVPFGQSQGICMARAGIGQECGRDMDDGKPLCAECSLCALDKQKNQLTCQQTGRSGDVCFDDSECLDSAVWSCVKGRCEVKPREGERCVLGETPGSIGNCMYLDNFCQETSDGVDDRTGKCMPFPKMGEPCGNSFDRSPNCAEGICNERLGACSGLPVEGEACTFECATPELFCALPSAEGGTTGLCERRRTVGAACSMPNECDDSTFCDLVTFVCQPKRQPQEPCDGFDQCLSRCDFGLRVCAPFDRTVALGGTCSVDLDCQSGRCDYDTGQCVADCQVAVNTEGCMNYDLQSISGYLFFAVVTMPILTRRRFDRR